MGLYHSYAFVRNVSIIRIQILLTALIYDKIMISLVEHVINAISNATFIVMEAIMFAIISEAMFVFQCRQFLY